MVLLPVLSAKNAKKMAEAIQYSQNYTQFVNKEENTSNLLDKFFRICYN